MKKIAIELPSSVSCKIFDFGEDFQYVDNVPEVPPLSVNNEHHIDLYGFKLSETEVEIFKRHREAWQCLIDSDDDYALILENNVDFYTLHIDKRDIRALPKGWHVFFPYNMQEIVMSKTEKPNILNENVREQIDVDPFLTGVEWGSSFYFISKKGAHKLLRNIYEIKQRVEDEIIDQSLNGLLTVFISNCEWMDISKIHPKQHADRLRNIRDAVFNYNTWDLTARSGIRKLLEHVSEISISLDIPLLLQGGTHLGYVRHGTIMGWDDDVDLGIEECRFKEFSEEVQSNGYHITRCIEQRTNTVFFKIWCEDGIQIKGFDYKFPLIDLWLYNTIGDDIVFNNGIICPNSASAPFESIIFEGSRFFIPYNSLEILDSRYKDWRTTIRIYSLSHAEEAATNHILSTSIKVDENGRIIDSH